MTMESQSQSQMQIQTQMNKESSRRQQGKNGKLSLENYIDFLHSHQTLHLTMNHLNQIIRIHGFKKIYHSPKKVLIDAVNALDLVDLPRSTLSQSVSAFAILTLEDAIADLKELNWTECCVTSIYTLSSRKENFSPPDPDQNLQTTKGLQTMSQTKAPDKTWDINEIYNLPEASQNGRRRATKMVPKRKRIKGDALDCASTLDCVSLASC